MQHFVATIPVSAHSVPNWKKNVLKETLPEQETATHSTFLYVVLYTVMVHCIVNSIQVQSCLA